MPKIALIYQGEMHIHFCKNTERNDILLENFKKMTHMNMLNLMSFL